MNLEKKHCPRIRGVQPVVQRAAIFLRQESTRAECILWNALRGKQFANLKFRRQHAVGQVIFDFYCPLHKLAIELDGSVHDTQQKHDQIRTKHVESFGYRVIRFRNEEVLEDLDSVLSRILEATKF